jgi:hypothetical protein
VFQLGFRHKYQGNVSHFSDPAPPEALDQRGQNSFASFSPLPEIQAGLVAFTINSYRQNDAKFINSARSL